MSQSDLFGTRPVVANHLNIPKPPEGEPTLLTWDEVTTAFHEFGHALHGLLSDVKYPRFAGTNVPRDFVEYPSQVNEMWMVDPAVLANYAKHYKTGALPPGCSHGAAAEVHPLLRHDESWPGAARRAGTILSRRIVPAGASRWR